MKSPFPGMDPYLEPHWLDVHTKLVAYTADALNEKLPDDLIASTEERVAVESESGEEHIFGPDVRVFEAPADEPHMVDQPPGGAVAAPFRLIAQVEPIIERFIRIIEARTERLITVIDFVSPTNKVQRACSGSRASVQNCLRRASTSSRSISFARATGARCCGRIAVEPRRFPRIALPRAFPVIRAPFTFSHSPFASRCQACRSPSGPATPRSRLISSRWSIASIPTGVMKNVWIIGSHLIHRWRTMTPPGPISS
jgi:hypothetical protein